MGNLAYVGLPCMECCYRETFAPFTLSSLSIGPMTCVAKDAYICMHAARRCHMGTEPIY